MRKIQFVNDCLYHVYNRGTEKRIIFLNDADYFRFIHDLYEFNDIGFTANLTRKIERGSTSLNTSLNNSTSLNNNLGKKREPLVKIVAFCLMPNHFHFILCQKKEGGIVKFMQKIGTGYTMYFNQKNKRSGALFQGRFKAILANKDEYFLPLLNYIHLNPVELIEPNWKEKGIKDKSKVNNFLNNYRWSSWPDYIGIKNFPSVINKEFFSGYLKKMGDYRKFINQRIVKDTESIKDIILE